MGKRNGIDYCVQSYGTGQAFGSQKCTSGATCQNVFANIPDATTMAWDGTAQCVESIASCDFNDSRTRILRAPGGGSGGSTTTPSGNLREPVDLAKEPYTQKTAHGQTYVSYGTSPKRQIILHHTASAGNTPAFGPVPAPGGTVPAHCHYWIETTGKVDTLADDTDILRCQALANVTGIGIEIVGTGGAFTNAQIEAAATKVRELAQKHNIPLDNTSANINTQTGGVFSHAQVCAKYNTDFTDTKGRASEGYHNAKPDPNEANFKRIMERAIQLNGGTGKYIAQPRCGT